MIKGVSSIKDKKIQHGEDCYLISASTLHRDIGDAYYITVIQNSYIQVELLECADFDEMLKVFSQKVEHYKTVAEA